MPRNPMVRAALYRALARLPGIRFGGKVRSLAGRVGVGVWAPVAQSANSNRLELIVDPATGTILGDRTIVASFRLENLPVGTIYSQAAIVQQAITRSPRPPR
jgi:hypothetical protein